MTKEYLEDVIDSHNRYCEWTLGGREDECLGGALLDELKERLTTIFHVDGDLASLKKAKGASGLELTLRRKT